MPLTEGDQLGPYQILESIGSGGMGEVYRARDPRLGREVAIKVSQQKFSERFEREARAVASLNHPNICTLYDVGDDYLVMELVEGPTLAERIHDGPLPLGEALRIARQIADALEAAHEKGIIHRDLKPGNVKIRPDGSVKVLDFGLAKMEVSTTEAVDESPTMASGDTQAGMILGTAAYMSPEQAKGRAVDQRSDIYSFGLVLYEMVTGERIHRGDSATEILASVIKEEPDWTRVPPELQRLMRRCLEKDPQNRQRHIGDVMALVDTPQTVGQPPAAATASRPLWPWILVAGAAVAIALAVGLLVPRQGPPEASIRFEIQPTSEVTFIEGSYPMVSPDGRWVVFPGLGTDGVVRMWLRALDSVEVRPLVGTESENVLPPPVFWSPDSRSIAFSSTPGPFAPGQLKRLDIAGGPAQTITEIPASVSGGTWNRDGVIVFTSNTTAGLFQVAAAGGIATPVTALDGARGETAHRAPHFLPDGRRFLYFRASSDPQAQGIYVGSLDAAPEEQSLEVLLAGDRQAVYAPPLAGGPGYLLFLRDTTLFAQPFNPDRAELSGEAVPITDQVGSFAAANVGLFSVSPTGVLTYRVGPGGDSRQLTWLDREGQVAGAIGNVGAYSRPVVSPDGTRVAVTRFDAQGGNSDIWVLDLDRGGAGTKLTFSAGRNDYAVWSPDGTQIAYASNHGGRFDIYRKNADGTGEETLLLASDSDKYPQSWSQDGGFLMYVNLDLINRGDLWLLPLEGQAAPVPFLQTDFDEPAARLSPDGRWIAYSSNESGNYEIYVRPVSLEGDGREGGRWLISTNGGIYLSWRGDGAELFYLDLSLRQFAVDIATDNSVTAGIPRHLFNVSLIQEGDVSADGQRFLYPNPENSAGSSPFIVMTNWPAALDR